MPSKNYLLNKMVTEPRRFSDFDFIELVNKKGKEAVTFDDLRNNVRRIYDMNESSLLTASDAMQGGLGKLNLRKQKRRRENFFDRIRDGRRTKKYKTIVAEGDSWFCFPFYVKDINDWLIDDDRINLYSIAAAGDWVTNIIYEGKYVEELSLIEPEVFLISGGGNDICGSNRLASMVSNNANEKLEGDAFLETAVAEAFDAFIWTLKTQYWILLSSLKKAEKLKDLKVITQGYDYIIPFPKIRRSSDLIQWAINKFSDTGNWLRTPLMLKGIMKIESHVTIMVHLIDEVNEMFKWLATYKEEGSDDFKFPNLYHVDCRHVAGGYKGWFDEIHLKSEKFEVVAKAYKHLIFETQSAREMFDANQKVVKAVWFNPDRNSPPTAEEKRLAMELTNKTR